jgi:ABC-2 type transport system ATP-binding protein
MADILSPSLLPSEKGGVGYAGGLGQRKKGNILANSLNPSSRKPPRKTTAPTEPRKREKIFSEDALFLKVIVSITPSPDGRIRWHPAKRRVYPSFMQESAHIYCNLPKGYFNRSYFMPSAITTDIITKSFGDLKAVDSVSLSVEKGSLFGLLGQNGSGKTTMIKMLTGQMKPSFGTAQVLGIDPSTAPVAVREAVGIIPEQETPPSFLTSEEYLSFIGKIRNIEDVEEKSQWWFEYLDFGDKRGVLCKDLSRGTRQKLMFAQAFLHTPALALIDEPLINLDPVMQRKVKRFLTDYVRSGNTIFLSTHILEIAEDICTNFAILHKGRLLHTGTVSELTDKQIHLDDFFMDLVERGHMDV